MIDCINYDIEYDAEIEQLDFMLKHGHDKNDVEINVPIRVTIGVTIALCGVFLLFVPVPVCQTWAPRVIATGVSIAADGCMDRMEEDRKK